VGETALAGSIVLAIMALPTIITVSEDAIRNTPRSRRRRRSHSEPTGGRRFTG
jgi:ABC-type phosphate transport system permease subunit